MEASALRYRGGVGLHGRSPLLRLQSDERLIAIVRRGNPAAFEVLFARYQSRLLAFCRHLLGSREDAEDVLQEVMAAAYNAILADERAINVRPWLYRIARNRCLNHLRRVHAIGVDSMDIHLSDFGASTADKVHLAEEFRMLVGDIQGLPETQRTALVLREMDALSYEQIAEAMETTVPSVKSLLVRARLSLAEAAEARMLSCEQVRIELAEVAEGLLNRPSAPVRRHLRSCKRCHAFQGELRRTTKALAALLPIGPIALLKQLLIAHVGHSAGAGASSSAAGAAGTGAAGTGVAGTGVAGTGVAVGSGAMAGGAAISGGGFLPLGIGAIATKAAAGLAAAALVTGAAVEVSHTGHRHARQPLAATSTVHAPASALAPARVQEATPVVDALRHASRAAHVARHRAAHAKPKVRATSVPVKLDLSVTTKPGTKHRQTTAAGRTESDSVATVVTSGAGHTSGSGVSGQSTSTSTGSSGQTTTTTTTTSGTESPTPSGDTASTPPTGTDGGTTTTSPTGDGSGGGVSGTGTPITSVIGSPITATTGAGIGVGTPAG